MKPPLRILQVCLSGSWGGLEMGASYSVDYFFRRGHFSPCLCRKNSELHWNLKQKNLPFFALDLYSRYSPLAVLKIRRLLKQQGIEIVHLHNPRDIWLLSPAMWGLGRVKLFASSPMLFTRTRKKDPLHRLLYGRLEKMINLSLPVQKQMQKNLPLPPEKHLVIPNPVDLEKFNPEKYDRNHFRDKWGVQPDEILVGLVGRLDPGKGHREMILALGEIAKKCPRVKLVVVGRETAGEHTGYATELKSLARESGLEDRIIWAGFTEEIPQVLKSVDIFVMPSYQEAFGLVLIEAMAMRLPVVATNAGGAPEILDYGKCGILIPPRQTAPLAEAVITLIKNPGLKNKLARAGRERVEKVYALDVVLDQLEDLYYGSLNIPKRP